MKLLAIMVSTVVLTIGISAEVAVSGPTVAQVRSTVLRVRSTATPKPKPDLRPVFRIKTKEKIFFLTVDDGITKSPEALRYVIKHKIPTTAFPTITGAGGRTSYFKRFTQFGGGTIENHTYNHEKLNTTPNLQHVICGAERAYGREFGTRPTMLRPPYGISGYRGDTSPRRIREIRRVAAACGIQHIVMWDVDVRSAHNIQYTSGGIRRGSIVLMHFTPELPSMLKAVMKLARLAGLKPVALSQYLT